MKQSVHLSVWNTNELVGQMDLNVRLVIKALSILLTLCPVEINLDCSFLNEKDSA